MCILIFLNNLRINFFEIGDYLWYQWHTENKKFIFYSYFLHRNHPEILKHLLENGASPNHKNKYRDTPLHFAAKYGYVECLKLLLEDERCDLNVKVIKTTNIFLNLFLNWRFIHIEWLAWGISLQTSSQVSCSISGNIKLVTRRSHQIEHNWKTFQRRHFPHSNTCK